MTRMLVVASPTVDVLCTGTPLPTEGEYPYHVAVWQKGEHWMLPGTHERVSGPECVCGHQWDYWGGECGGGATTGAVVATAEVTGKGHHADVCLNADDDWDPSRGPYCDPDALPDCWHTPTGQVTRLDVPIPVERPDYPHGPRVGDWMPEPTGWWWADLDLEVPA